MAAWRCKEMEISMREHRPVCLIYMDRHGVISQRVVQVTGLSEEEMQGYCYTRREPRTFRRERILAVSLQVPRTARGSVGMRRIGG